MKRNIIILSLVLLSSLGFRGCGDAKKVWDALDREAGIPRHHARFAKEYRTPGGVPVTSTVDVPANVLPFIDAGINRQIGCYNAKYPFWSRYKLLGEYKVLFIEPSGVSEVSLPGAPIIHVGGYGSAGTCIGCNPISAVRPDLYIVLPHQKAQNWRFTEYLKNAADYESEHVREFRNDYNIFIQWAHSGDVHPHCAPDGFASPVAFNYHDMK